MKIFAQIEVDSSIAMTDVKIAREVAKAIKKEVNGSSSALECMELETYRVYHVTTFSKKSGELKHFKRPCELRRVTPLQIEVKVQYGRTTLEVSWDASGVIDDKHCYAEITALATWENGWYKWDNCEDDGTPDAPLATIYISEESI